jgi:hypothetical protein
MPRGRRIIIDRRLGATTCSHRVSERENPTPEMVLGSTIALEMLGSALLYPTDPTDTMVSDRPEVIGNTKLKVVPSCCTELNVISP